MKIYFLLNVYFIITLLQFSCTKLCDVYKTCVTSKCDDTNQLFNEEEEDEYIGKLFSEWINV